MRVRQMSPSGDMTFGRGAACFLVNSPAAVAQVARTRLGLYVGDWFLDLLRGTPWAQRVLGRHPGRDLRRDAAIRSRLLTTPGVSALSSYSSSINRATRAMSVQAQLDTVYGPAPASVSLRDPTPYFKEGLAQP